MLKDDTEDNLAHRRSRADVAALATLAIGLTLWTVAAVDLRQGPVGMSHDDGIYLTSARALLDGDGYRLPSRPDGPRPKYPIGFPASIAFALRCVPGSRVSLERDVAIARGLVLAAGWVACLATYCWLRRVAIRPAGATLMALASIAHHVVLPDCAGLIFSDLPFFAVSAVLLARWAARRPRLSLRSSMLDGLLAGAAMLLRSNGITLVLAALFAAWLRPSRRAAVLACVAGIALVVVPLEFETSRYPKFDHSGDYMLEMRAGWSSWESGLKGVATNLRSMACEYPTDLVLPNTTQSAPVLVWLQGHRMVRWGLHGAVGVVVLVGVARLARSSRRLDAPAWLHAIGTAAIFAVWPWNFIMGRFLLSLSPFLLLAFTRGVEGVAGALGAGPRVRRTLMLAGLSAVLAGDASIAVRNLMRHNLMLAEPEPSHLQHSSLQLALDFIRHETEPDAVVLAMHPEMVFLHTGRQVIPLIEDDDALLGRCGRLDRLDLWLARIPARPLYALIREPSVQADGFDGSQITTLRGHPGIVLRTVYLSPAGHHRVIRVDGRTSLTGTPPPS
jgi:hypothetical protein